MKEFSLLTFASKNLKRKAFRTGVLAFSVALVVCTLVFGLSIIINVNSSIKRSADRLGADLLVIPVGASRFAEEVLLETESKSFYMDARIIDRIKETEGIERVTCQTYLTTIPSICCDVPETKVVAFDQETDFIIQPWLKKAIGRRLEKGEAIVGYESFLNIGRGLMDIDANLFGNRFRMVGALEKTDTGLDNAIFITGENIRDIIRKGKAALKPGQISVIFTKVKKGYDPYQVGRAVEGKIVEVDVVARKDIGKNILAALHDIRRIFGVLVILASLLSVFLAWSIFSAIANERTREVGIMRAIGAKERHVAGLFLIEVLLVGVLGSAFGAVSGTALSMLLAKSFTILKTLSTDLSALERVFIAGFGFVAGTVVCVLGALSPVLRMKKLEPFIAIKEG